MKPCRAGLGSGWVTRREYPVLKAPTLIFIYLFFILILGDPGSVTRVERKGATKRFTVQIGEFLLIASEMFSRVIGSSFVSG